MDCNEEGATAADRQKLTESERCRLTFELRVCQRTETVSLLSNMPYRMLVKTHFMKKDQFKIDMHHNVRSMIVNGVNHEEPIAEVVCSKIR